MSASKTEDTLVDAMARLTISPIFDDLRRIDVSKLRRIIRTGAYDGHTNGLARTRLQANLIILPRRFARDFQQFCIRNPKSCPLIGVSRHGSPMLPTLGDIDVRVDAPRYDIYRFGELVRRETDITHRWQDDFAAFALGSAFTFEQGLIDRGLELRSLAAARATPTFRSSIRTFRVGPFGGEMVVSMRPIRREDIDKVRAVTARYPHAHGAPIHVGDPAAIGIHDIRVPDWGDAIEIRPGEVPVFWASGMTAQNALEHARPDIWITHSPGHMLITDVDARADVGAFKIF
jgi:uncharacterized protein YcsI (UPF0317 family)